MMNITSRIKWNERKVICVVMIILLLLGVCIVQDYGIWYDENVEIDIARMDLKEYVRFICGSDSHIYQFMDSKIGNLMDSVEIDHGEAMIYPAAVVVSVFREMGHAEWGMWFYHYYLWLWFLAGLLCLYFTGKYLTRRKRWGVVTAAMLLLHPRFFAEAFFNNKDVLMLSATAISIWLGICFVEKKNWKWSIFWGASVAFCMNLRVIGALYAVLFGSLYFAEYIKDGWKDWMRFRNGLVAIAAILIVFIAITPATWYSLIMYFQYTLKNAAGFSRWDNWILYMGELYRYSVKPLPWHYLLVLIGVTAPVGIVFAMLAGQVCFIKDIILSIRKRNIQKGNRKYILLLGILFWFPMLFYIIKGSNVYNGWRHFYFVYPVLIVLAAVALSELEQIWRIGKGILWMAIAVQGVFCIYLLFSAHPLQYVYFNSLAGNDVENTFELDTGNVSFQYALKQILKQDDSEKILISSDNLSSYYGIKMAWEVLPKDEKVRIQIAEPETLECASADYHVYNHTTVTVDNKICKEGLGEQNLWKPGNNYERLFSVEAYGMDVLDIYKIQK